MFSKDSQEANPQDEPLCLDDVEKKAKEKSGDHSLKYFIGGADEELTLRDNIDAFKRIRLRPRMLRGVDSVDLSTTVLGQRISMPICVAPTGFHKLAHPDGEVATARACARSQTLMTLSVMSSSSIEEINFGSPGCLRWQQFYVIKERQLAENIVKESLEKGSKALVLTVDATEMGKRRQTSNPTFFEGLHCPLLDNRKLAKGPPSDVFKKDITWDTISWLKSLTKLPLIIKGILTAEDARLAVQYGVDAIIVSNHGGRQLDGVLAAIDALPEVVKAVNGQVEVYMDGGVRLGTDVLKALALGARAVFIGRPVLYGLAYQGEEGVYKVLEILRDELRKAMVLSGCSSISDITDSLVTKQCQCRL